MHAALYGMCEAAAGDAPRTAAAAAVAAAAAAVLPSGTAHVASSLGHASQDVSAPPYADAPPLVAAKAPLPAGSTDAWPPDAGVPPEPLSAPREPTSLRGRDAMRAFQTGWYNGVVEATRASPRYGQLWTVRYEDGDAEELPYAALRRFLRPAAAHEDAAAQQAQQAATQRAAPPLPPAAGASSDEEVLSDEEDANGGSSGRDVGGLAPAVAAPRKYIGVFKSRDRRKFQSKMKLSGKQQHLGTFLTADAAARAYDAAVRRLRLARAVNFPETQAERDLAGADTSKQKQHPCNFAAGKLHGVFRDKTVRAPRWRAIMKFLGTKYSLGSHGSPEEAGRAYDAAVRRLGAPLARLNFPTTDEQAHILGLPTTEQPEGDRDNAPPPQVPPPLPLPLSSLEVFVRAITPPLLQVCGAAAQLALCAVLMPARSALSQLDAIVAAIPASGTSLAQLARACAGPPSAFSAAVVAAMHALRVQLPGDQLAFMLAVAALLRSPAWVQVAAGDA